MADFTPHSFAGLNEWLKGNTTTRRRTEAEIAEIRRTFKFPIPVPDVDLSNETLSLVYDIAMYVTSALRRSHPHLEWTINLHDKVHVDYGQPILIGCSKNVPLNPVRIVSNIAYAVIEGTSKTDALNQVFGYWSNRAARMNRVH